ncbi:hypothetical protein T4A_8140 [Trichinella pseudospiralis]|uniref:Uncharacterized protein n=1 Tax=Trichinella pseudospiralis TaxID=6337 RepID=A0A0V1EFR6_TRIPS|nr:hypothetical protein T4A_8140 [Trichinella pseudospiralis]
MANMPGVGLEIFKAGGGWRDQKWAPPRSVKLPSLRQGRMQTLPCSLGRCAGSLVFFPCSQGRGDCAFCLPNRVGRVQSSLLFGQSEGECSLPCSLGRWSARSPTLERGKPKLSALKRWIWITKKRKCENADDTKQIEDDTKQNCGMKTYGICGSPRVPIL